MSDWLACAGYALIADSGGVGIGRRCVAARRAVDDVGCALWVPVRGSRTRVGRAGRTSAAGGASLAGAARVMDRDQAAGARRRRHTPGVSTVLATRQWGRVGDPREPRALLVHGITSSAETMWELGEGLAAAGWAATAIDLPGHGGSGPADSYRHADVADAVAAQLGGGFDLYVGHSLGGAVGTELLARHPMVARGAVLIDPALVVSEESVADIPAQLIADKARTAADIAADRTHWHPRTVRARVAATAAADLDAVRGWLADNRPWDLTAAAGQVQIPVLVLMASNGSAVAPHLVDTLPAANPHWRFETVPDTTHSIHRDRPAVVLARLLG